MKKQILFWTIIFIAIVNCHFSLTTAQIKPVKNGIELNANGINLKVQFYSDKIVRITKWVPEGTSEKLSLSVIKKNDDDLGIEIEETDNDIILNSSILLLRVSKYSGNIEYLTADSNIILKEQGKPSFKTVVYDSDSGFTIQQNFKLTKNEGVYGLGEQTDGYFNYRGKKIVLAQANVGASSSFLI